MRRRRWPDGAESQRLAAIQCIKEARRLIRVARQNAKIDPTLQTMALADAGEQLADAERYLTLARLGQTEEDDE